MENTEIQVCSVVKAVKALNTSTPGCGCVFYPDLKLLRVSQWDLNFILGHRNRCLISAVAYFGGK